MPTIPASISQLTADAETLIDRLIAWSNLNSGSTHLAGLGRMADELESALRELTPDITRIPLDDHGRVAIRATCRVGADRRILCSGHYDTVFNETHSFQRARRTGDGQRLNGPGVADMKGGIVAMLATLAAFEQTAHAANLGWTVLLTPDEETGSVASCATIRSEAPLHELALVFEPARESGAMVRSRAATGVFDLTVHGRAAHAGRNPEDGRNAIMAVSRLLPAIDQLPSQIDGLMVNIATIRGGGTINIVPDSATVELNARASTTTAAERFSAELAKIAASIHDQNGFRATFSGAFNRDPLQSTPLREQLFTELQGCARELGQPALEWAHVTGGSDANLLQAAGLPCLDGLGPIGGGLHSADEYIEVPSLVARAQLAALFLHRLANGQITVPQRS